MMFLAFVLVSFFVGYPIYWVYRKLTKNKRPSLPDNPYIIEHKYRRLNDKWYDEYLEWLDDTGGDLPIKKELTLEELEFEQELKKSKL